MVKQSYRIVLTSDTTCNTSDYISHYGVKGMKWGVVNEEKPDGPQRSSSNQSLVNRLRTSVSGSQAGPSPSSNQGFWNAVASEKASTLSSANKTKEPIQGFNYIPSFKIPPDLAKNKNPYTPSTPVETVPDAWDLWKTELGIDALNDPDTQKYGGYVNRTAEAFANYLKNLGINQISDITDSRLESYDMAHIKNELERIINDSRSHLPYIPKHWDAKSILSGATADQYRQDFLLSLKRNGFDFFDPTDKVMYKEIGYYPTSKEKVKWQNDWKKRSLQVAQKASPRPVRGINDYQDSRNPWRIIKKRKES